jgi:hypothetical protein
VAGVALVGGDPAVLEVAGGEDNQILEFGTENEALFKVSLSAPLAAPVMVVAVTLSPSLEYDQLPTRQANS